jgi:hypothetical protein
VCRGAEFARSNFQCSRERLLVHEQNRTLWQQLTATTANDLFLSNKEGATKNTEIDLKATYEQARWKKEDELAGRSDSKPEATKFRTK